MYSKLFEREREDRWRWWFRESCKKKDGGID
jgi:hypothetical protein